MHAYIELYAIDEQGRITETLSGDEQMVALSKMPGITYIDVPVPAEFVRPYWNGACWAEAEWVPVEEDVDEGSLGSVGDVEGEE